MDYFGMDACLCCLHCGKRRAINSAVVIGVGDMYQGKPIAPQPEKDYCSYLASSLRQLHLESWSTFTFLASLRQKWISRSHRSTREKRMSAELAVRLD
jgi:hypothetical protein